MSTNNFFSSEIVSPAVNKSISFQLENEYSNTISLNINENEILSAPMFDENEKIFMKTPIENINRKEVKIEADNFFERDTKQIGDSNEISSESSELNIFDRMDENDNFMDISINHSNTVENKSINVENKSINTEKSKNTENVRNSENRSINTENKTIGSENTENKSINTENEMIERNRNIIKSFDVSNNSDTTPRNGILNFQEDINIYNSPNVVKSQSPNKYVNSNNAESILNSDDLEEIKRYCKSVKSLNSSYNETFNPFTTKENNTMDYSNVLAKTPLLDDYKEEEVLNEFNSFLTEITKSRDNASFSSDSHERNSDDNQNVSGSSEEIMMKKKNVISNVTKLIGNFKEDIAKRNVEIEEYISQINTLEMKLFQKDKESLYKSNEIEEKDNIIRSKDIQISKQMEIIRETTSSLTKKDEIIDNLIKEIKESKKSGLKDSNYFEELTNILKGNTTKLDKLSTDNIGTQISRDKLIEENYELKIHLKEREREISELIEKYQGEDTLNKNMMEKLLEENQKLMNNFKGDINKLQETVLEKNEEILRLKREIDVINKQSLQSKENNEIIVTGKISDSNEINEGSFLQLLDIIEEKDNELYRLKQAINNNASTNNMEKVKNEPEEPRKYEVSKTEILELKDITEEGESETKRLRQITKNRELELLKNIESNKKEIEKLNEIISRKDQELDRLKASDLQNSINPELLRNLEEKELEIQQLNNAIEGKNKVLEELKEVINSNDSVKITENKSTGTDLRTNEEKIDIQELNDIIKEKDIEIERLKQINNDNDSKKYNEVEIYSDIDFNSKDRKIKDKQQSNDLSKNIETISNEEELANLGRSLPNKAEEFNQLDNAYVNNKTGLNELIDEITELTREKQLLIEKARELSEELQAQKNAVKKIAENENSKEMKIIYLTNKINEENHKNIKLKGENMQLKEDINILKENQIELSRINEMLSNSNSENDIDLGKSEYEKKFLDLQSEYINYAKRYNAKKRTLEKVEVHYIGEINIPLNKQEIDQLICKFEERIQELELNNNNEVKKLKIIISDFQSKLNKKDELVKLRSIISELELKNNLLMKEIDNNIEIKKIKENEDLQKGIDLDKELQIFNENFNKISDDIRNELENIISIYMPNSDADYLVKTLIQDFTELKMNEKECIVEETTINVLPITSFDPKLNKQSEKLQELINVIKVLKIEAK